MTFATALSRKRADAGQERHARLVARLRWSSTTVRDSVVAVDAILSVATGSVKALLHRGGFVLVGLQGHASALIDVVLSSGHGDYDCSAGLLYAHKNTLTHTHQHTHKYTKAGIDCRL